MGQSQLLMLVLAVIIVGIAVAVGITQLQEGALTANADGLLTDCQTITAKAQGWYRKPTSLGGGGNSFVGATLPKVGASGTNDNGSYTLNVASTNQVTCVGTGHEMNASDALVQVTMHYYAAQDSFVTTNNM
jgi:hypothetical protein